MLALMLEMDNMWVKIAVSPVDQGVDEAELFRIAESLVDYQG